MRNAIAPSIVAAHRHRRHGICASVPRISSYTSAPYRGLDVLLQAFPAIREAIPDVRLRIFSGLSTTRGGPEDNKYADLHQKCLSLEGVDYAGPVSQPELALDVK